MTTVRTEHLYKVFGPKPVQALRELHGGATREDLRAGGHTAAVVDASFEAKEGETFVVMGLSGSGKSTLIRMLNGLLPATAGSVFVDDSDVTQLDAKALRSLRSHKMSMVFQHFALFPHRSVLDNAAYGLEVRGQPKDVQRRQAMDALEQVGLQSWARSYPSQLSGGMKQRVGLARALATDTDVMLMDEAFSALDPLIRREMQDQLIQLQARLHKTIVFITHDLNEAMKLGDRIAMLRAGSIVQIGSAEEILDEPANDYVATFVADVDRSRVLTAGAIMVQPPATAGTDERVATARATLRREGLDGLLVVDRDRRVQGMVTSEALATVDETQTVGDVAHRDIVSTAPETAAVELFEPCSRSPLPLAVLDAQQRLLGVVTRSALLGALGGSQEPGAPDAGGDSG